MTFEEKLEFLFKSTESLHATVQEHINAQAERNKVLEASFARTEANLARLDASVDKLVVNMDKLAVNMNKLTQVMAALGSTALDHEDRVTKLEGDK